MIKKIYVFAFLMIINIPMLIDFNHDIAKSIVTSDVKNKESVILITNEPQDPILVMGEQLTAGISIIDSIR